MNLFKRGEHMNNKEFRINQHKYLCGKIHETYVKKNNDYGDSFTKAIDEFGYISVAIRLTDKLERFKTLLNKDMKVTDEKITDTLLDMANYCIMTVVDMSNREKNLK